MDALDPEKIRSVVQVCLTAIFVLAAFAVLLLGAGQEGTARLAAGWLGAVLGFWLR
jgi:small-conductance mechanosensitive channel